MRGASAVLGSGSTALKEPRSWGYMGSQILWVHGVLWLKTSNAQADVGDGPFSPIGFLHLSAHPSISREVLVCLST